LLCLIHTYIVRWHNLSPRRTFALGFVLCLPFDHKQD
ncbi:hypothetical protein CFC21_022821, partial [Triticum aestivum]